MAFNRVEKETIEAFNNIQKILVKRQQKTRWLLVLLEALKNYIKDCKNKIQGFLIYQKNYIKWKTIINLYKYSQRNASRV